MWWFWTAIFGGILQLVRLGGGGILSLLAIDVVAVLCFCFHVN